MPSRNESRLPGKIHLDVENNVHADFLVFREFRRFIISDFLRGVLIMRLVRNTHFVHFFADCLVPEVVFVFFVNFIRPLNGFRHFDSELVRCTPVFGHCLGNDRCALFQCVRCPPCKRRFLE